MNISMNPLEVQIHEFQRLILTTDDEAKIDQMKAAIASLQAKLDNGISELEEEEALFSLASNSSPGKSLINKVGKSQHPVIARPQSARRRSTSNPLDIIPEEKKRLLQNYKHPPTPTRRVRNSIKLSAKGSVVDIISTEVYEEVKNMGEADDRNEEEGKESGIFERLVISRDGDDTFERGRNVVIHGGGGGSSLGARFRNVTSPVGIGGVGGPFGLNKMSKDKDTGYSSSESVSSVGSQDMPIVRKKKNKRDKHGAGVGGLDDVLEETSTAVFSGFNMGVEEAGHRFGAPVNEIKEEAVEYCCTSSGDLGHTHTLSSTWIPTGLYPQTSRIRFKVPIYLSKVIVECSGVRRMSLIIGEGDKGIREGGKERVHVSPILPETVLITNARHTEMDDIEILDTPRSTLGKGMFGGKGDLEGGKKVWNAGHLGHASSPSPGVIKVGNYSGSWATHTFNVAEDGDSVRCKEVEIVIEEGHGSSFAVVRKVKVLGMEEVGGGGGGVGVGGGGGSGRGLSSRLGNSMRRK